MSRERNDVRKWLSGRASPCQGEGREFESRFPLLALRVECFFCFVKRCGKISDEKLKKGLAKNV